MHTTKVETCLHVNLNPATPHRDEYAHHGGEVRRGVDPYVGAAQGVGANRNKLRVERRSCVYEPREPAGSGEAEVSRFAYLETSVTT